MVCGERGRTCYNLLHRRAAELERKLRQRRRAPHVLRVAQTELAAAAAAPAAEPRRAAARQHVPRAARQKVRPRAATVAVANDGRAAAVVQRLERPRRRLVGLAAMAEHAACAATPCEDAAVRRQRRRVRLAAAEQRDAVGGQAAHETQRRGLLRAAAARLDAEREAGAARQHAAVAKLQQRVPCAARDERHA